MEPRIVLLDGEVNEESALDVILQLLYYDALNDKEDINLYINSAGGYVLYGLAIYDTIQNIKAPVATVCFGQAASMGAFLLTCGAKGKRFALPHSRVLLHQPLIMTRQNRYKTESEMQRISKRILTSRNELEAIMAKNIGKPIEQIHIDCERDNWMDAQEALNYGIIDSIITDHKGK